MRQLAKRAIDLLLTIPALVVLSPLMAAVAVGVWLSMGRPVLFRQLRPGRNARPFMLLKFRTMNDRTDQQGHLLPDAERLTEFGRFLRATSLDELPQLWNVLRGEMSLVGPRPLLMRYMDFFSDEERSRFAVPPGITGLAQLSGRNHLQWDERLSKDVEYVRNWGLLLDLRILARTALSVVKREGVNVDAGSAMADLDTERKRHA